MKGIGKREIGLNILAILIGRIAIYGTNPFAIGLYAALCMEKIPRAFFAIGVLFGLWTSGTPLEIIKYAGVFLCFQVILRGIEKKNIQVPIVLMGILASGVTLVITLLQKGFFMGTKEVFWFMGLEVLLVFISTMIFHIGVHALLNGIKGMPLNNEELISIALLCGLAVYGLPALSGYDFSLFEAGVGVFILWMGYQYGSGAGAISGTVCGILMLLKGNGLELLGIFAVLGISAGLFRELGRVVTGISFALLYISAGYFYETSLWEVTKVRGLASAVVIFLLLPKAWTKKVDLHRNSAQADSYGKQSIQMLTQRKLSEFAASFQKLSKTFYSIADTKEQLDKKDIDRVLAELTQKVCSQCEKSNRCLGYTRHEKYQTSVSVLEAVKSNGYVLASDLPKDFANKCDYLELYLQETNRELEFAKLNLNWYNRMAESREAIADQLGEVAHIIKNFSKEVYDTKEIAMQAKSEIIAILKRNQIEVSKITMIEKVNKHQEIYFLAKSKKGRCIPTREAAGYISEVLKKRFKPSSDTKNIISKQSERIVLVEDTNFKTLTGMARMSKEGEIVSGDNFSFVQLETGEMIMSLSDGMGSGINACEESESVIELLEGFMEAGFKEESAIKLINSILVLKSNEQTFSTVDMAVINLFTGICDFIKIGASTTFLKRADWVETIHSTTLPIGIFNHVDYDNVSKKLYDGDFIIMVSDGVLDCVSGENKEEFFEKLLGEMTLQNPKEIANVILERAIEENNHVAEDDMTVLVAGVWRK